MTVTYLKYLHFKYIYIYVFKHNKHMDVSPFWDPETYQDSSDMKKWFTNAILF